MARSDTEGEATYKHEKPFLVKISVGGHHITK